METRLNEYAQSQAEFMGGNACAKVLIKVKPEALRFHKGVGDGFVEIGGVVPVRMSPGVDEWGWSAHQTEGIDLCDNGKIKLLSREEAVDRVIAEFKKHFDDHIA